MDIPQGWERGELLDVKNFTTHFEVSPIAPRLMPDDDPEAIQPYKLMRLDAIRFDSAEDTQAFVSLWYARAYQ